MKPETKYHTTDKKPHRCPICEGRGNVPRGFYEPYQSGSSSYTTGEEQCQSCLGSGIVWG